MSLEQANRYLFEKQYQKALDELYRLYHLDSLYTSGDLEQCLTRNKKIDVLYHNSCLGLANQYINLSKFQDALNILDKYPIRTAKITSIYHICYLNIAFKYVTPSKKDLAVLKAYQHNEEKLLAKENTFINLAEVWRCILSLDFVGALAKLSDAPLQNESVNIVRHICYLEIAFKNGYRSISRTTYLIRGEYYQKAGQYSKALSIYFYIPTTAVNTTVLLNRAHCQEKLQHDDMAISLYRKVDALMDSSQQTRTQRAFVMKKLAELYHRIDDLENAENYYQQLQAHYAYDQEANLSYCRYLVVTNQPNVLPIINDCIRLWPNDIRMVLLKAEYEERIYGADIMVTLRNYESRFTHPSLFLVQLRDSLYKRNMNAAHYYANLVYSTNQGVFCQQSDGLLAAQSLIPLWGNDFVIDSQPNTTIAIDASVLAIMDEFDECFVFGEALLAMLNREPITSKVEIIISARNPDYLKCLGYTQSENASIYTKKFGSHTVECFISTQGINGCTNFPRNVSNQCVFANKLGQLFDPLGVGLYDIENGHVRLLKPISTDPLQLLTAVYFVAHGYKISKTSESEIKAFSPARLLRLNEGRTKLDFHLNQAYAPQFIDVLKQYGLEQLYVFHTQEKSTDYGFESLSLR